MAKQKKTRAREYTDSIIAEIDHKMHYGERWDETYAPEWASSIASLVLDEIKGEIQCAVERTLKNDDAKRDQEIAQLQRDKRELNKKLKLYGELDKVMKANK